MAGFENLIDQEIIKLEKEIKRISKSEKGYPKGSLVRRKKKNGYRLFARRYLKDKVKEQVVDRDYDLLQEYVNKACDMKTKNILNHNLKLLKSIRTQYLSDDQNTVFSSIPDAYRDAKERIDSNPDKKCNCLNYSEHFQRDKYHNQKADCGIWVRSKNELFICNGLDHAGIQFTYEEKQVINGHIYYPDFIIYLPDGRKIYWEHLGMLNKPDYFQDNADKIYNYYCEGIYPGRNLILTYNDADDNIDLEEINCIIDNSLAPYFHQKC